MQEFIITGHFDGKVIVPGKPLKLPVGTRLRITILPPATNSGKKSSKVAKKPVKRLRHP